MKFKLLTCVGLLGLLIAIGWAGVESTEAATFIESLRISGLDFSGGVGTGFDIATDGLTPSDSAMTAVYTSPVLEAPIPFNVVIPLWRADLPEGTSIALMMRTGDETAWSDWYSLEAHQDWHDEALEEQGEVGNIITVPATAVTHQYIQYQVSFSQYQSSEPPTLNEISFTFIDATQGPTSEELLAQQEALDAAGNTPQSADGGGYPRPPVISRELWCISVDCDYTDGLNYSPATHLIVHHTVSANDDSDWAAVVRAIWAFHTYPPSESCSSCRGWGDIGYNYLIDLDGIIYEGHNNEDYLTLDVVGTHAAGANTGSMGTALIGTFTAPDYPGLPGIEPPAPMLDAAVELLSWKADQRDIDVYDASNTLPFISWGLPHLMGHRDVYGTTECPGDQAHALLPWLRDQVAGHIGLVSPYIIVDELSADFTQSSSDWNVAAKGCGHDGHAYYAWSTTEPAESTNWGEWRPDIPEDGRYRIEAYVPYCLTGSAETDGATYEIHHLYGVKTVVRSHEENLGLWMSLGEYDFFANDNYLVRLTNLTTTDTGLGMWFDGIRLLRVGELTNAVSNEQPATNMWTNDPAIDFTWQITTTHQVLTTSLQVSTDISFTTNLVTETWPAAVYSHTHTFSQDGLMAWQVSTTISKTGGVTETVTSDPTWFGLDTAVPTSTIHSIYALSGATRYLLIWEGADVLSGVGGYNIVYRQQGDLAWTPWLTGTTAANGIFTPPDPAQTYEFRSQAVDVAGNIEPLQTEPATDTDQAIPLPHAIMLPIIRP